VYSTRPRNPLHSAVSFKRRRKEDERKERMKEED
jgi:hypothetical protein